jgi:hypothetical protein
VLGVAIASVKHWNFLGELGIGWKLSLGTFWKQEPLPRKAVILKLSQVDGKLTVADFEQRDQF